MNHPSTPNTTYTGIVTAPKMIRNTGAIQAASAAHTTKDTRATSADAVHKVRLSKSARRRLNRARRKTAQAAEPVLPSTPTTTQSPTSDAIEDWSSVAAWPSDVAATPVAVQLQNTPPHPCPVCLARAAARPVMVDAAVQVQLDAEPRTITPTPRSTEQGKLPTGKPPRSSWAPLVAQAQGRSTQAQPSGWTSSRATPQPSGWGTTTTRRAPQSSSGWVNAATASPQPTPLVEPRAVETAPAPATKTMDDDAHSVVSQASSVSTVMEHTETKSDGPLATNVFEGIDDFNEMGLPRNLLRGIFGHAFDKPSRVQALMIPQILKGRDVLAQARAGTGKTGSFGIGALARVNGAVNHVQAMILAPTAVVAEQIGTVLVELAKNMGIRVHTCAGGRSKANDVRALRRGVHVVVGSPSRLLDLYSQRSLDLRHLKITVLDEADAMLEEGVRGQVWQLLRGAPQDVQVAMFSATMTSETVRIAKKALRSPAVLLLDANELSAPNIRQYHVQIADYHTTTRMDCLRDLFDVMRTSTQTIVFVNRKTDAEMVHRDLVDAGFVSDYITGAVKPYDRDIVMKRFTSGAIQVLVTTDMFARGIDICTVGVVINYVLPLDRERYIHRIGRCGRFGRVGVAISLIAPNDRSKLDDIMSSYGSVVQPLPADVCAVLKSK